MTQLFQHLRLSRPLCVIDCETTGISPTLDRIVEIAVVRYAPGRTARRLVQRINPGMPIPAAASAVHGIFDRDVVGSPPFAAVAPRLRDFLAHGDLCGFNLARFDLPLLLNEFARAAVPFLVNDRFVIDVQRLFHRVEPRTLSAAVRRYLGRDHRPVHEAIADVRATAAVMDQILAHHSEIPRDVAQLHAMLSEVDVAGRLRLADDRVVLWFGKYFGQPLEDIAQRNPGYLEWLMGQDFLPDFKSILADALSKAADGPRWASEAGEA